MSLLGVEVHLNSTLELAHLSSLRPDAVIIATGAGPGLRFSPVVGSPKLFDLFSALDRMEDDWEGRVVITGGDSESCFLGLYAAGHGAEVHIIEPGPAFSLDKMSPGRDLLMTALEELPTVHLRAVSTVEEIGSDYVVLQKEGRLERLDEVQSVIIGGRTSNNSLYEKIRAELPELEVYNIGDSVRPRDVYAASHDAADVAEMIRRHVV